MTDLLTDLLASTAEMVGIASVSRHESELASHVERVLRSTDSLEVERFGDSVVARSHFGREPRVLLAGHLDTVPPFGDLSVQLSDDAVSGLGAVDMKGGLAVMLWVAGALGQASCDATLVFYACEEIEREANALPRLARERPDLFEADAAVLGEPTGAVVEAGCQGTMRARVRLTGARAHTARPFTGVNAVHRLGGVLDVLGGYRSRLVVIDGCEYAEQLQAVHVEGGVAGNVVPDEASLLVNYRFAPDRSAAAAETELRRMFEAVVDPGRGDCVEVLDVAPGAPPSLRHPVLERLVKATGAPPRAKMGWTDVATMAALGIPATNFGPGDPMLAHTPHERVTRAELEEARRVMGSLLGIPTPGNS